MKEPISDHKESPTCHYLWLGPPSDGKSREKYKISRTKKGHDLSLVLETTRKDKNPISFWCLEEFADYSSYKV